MDTTFYGEGTSQYSLNDYFDQQSLSPDTQKLKQIFWEYKVKPFIQYIENPNVQSSYYIQELFLNIDDICKKFQLEHLRHQIYNQHQKHLLFQHYISYKKLLQILRNIKNGEFLSFIETINSINLQNLDINIVKILNSYITSDYQEQYFDILQYILKNDRYWDNQMLLNMFQNYIMDYIYTYINYEGLEDTRMTRTNIYVSLSCVKKRIIQIKQQFVQYYTEPIYFNFDEIKHPEKIGKEIQSYTVGQIISNFDQNYKMYDKYNYNRLSLEDKIMLLKKHGVINFTFTANKVTDEFVLLKDCFAIMNYYLSKKPHENGLSKSLHDMVQTQILFTCQKHIYQIQKFFQFLDPIHDQQFFNNNSMAPITNTEINMYQDYMCMIIADCGMINDQRLFHVTYTDNIIGYLEYLNKHIRDIPYNIIFVEKLQYAYLEDEEIQRLYENIYIDGDIYIYEEHELINELNRLVSLDGVEHLNKLKEFETIKSDQPTNSTFLNDKEKDMFISLNLSDNVLYLFYRVRQCIYNQQSKILNLKLQETQLQYDRENTKLRNIIQEQIVYEEAETKEQQDLYNEQQNLIAEIESNCQNLSAIIDNILSLQGHIQTQQNYLQYPN